jgi:PrtD family type I secretion system ABC transporter
LRSIINSCLKELRFAITSVAVFSGVVNTLALTSSIYMLQVYDRVLSSRSVPTLLALSLGALWLYLIQAALDIIRSRMLTRISHGVEIRLAPKVFRIVLEMPLRMQKISSLSMQPLRDLDSIRSFLSGGGPIALFDLPWMPIYVGVIFLLHPSLGWFAVGGIITLFGLTILTDIATKEHTKNLVAETASRWAFLQSARANADIIFSMGMTERLLKTWTQTGNNFLASSLKLSDVSALLGGIGKAIRIIIQSATLGMGAYLVINSEATGGVMIAASILMSRALAPIELVIGQWKGLVSAKQAGRRLDQLISQFDQEQTKTQLPVPGKALSVSSIFVSAPGASAPIVQNISFRLVSGEALGVIGPSGSGKSTLIRAIVGAWRPSRGEVRIDGATMDQWPRSELGQYIGYLPQEIELFEGTISQNISRFEPDSDSKHIIEAAQAAGVHDLILKLDRGYDTQIGEGGYALSAGQRQRIALARALYRNPFLVILDEPNSNLDAEGDAALSSAIIDIKNRGGIIIIIAHRPSAIASMDYLLFLNNGQIQQFGPKDEVLRSVMKSSSVTDTRSSVSSVHATS